MPRIFRSPTLPAALLALSFCALSAPAGAAADKPLTIAVIPKGTTHEFWKAVHAGAVKASKELGVEILWKGPLREDDRSGQINIVEDMVTRQVSGLVLAPLDESALRAPVENAARGGTPTVVIDSALKSEKTAAFVATDNARAGALAAEALAQALGRKGNILVLRYAEGSASTAAREQGFLEAVKKIAGFKVVSSNQYGGATTETAYKASETLLGAYHGQIDGVFCPNESTTFGMLRGLEDAGLAGKVKFVGFDASAKLIDALKSGHIHALVVQDPLKMGYLGVKTIVEHLRGRSHEKRIDTGATVVTAKRLSEPAVRELLQPDLAKWLTN